MLFFSYVLSCSKIQYNVFVEDWTGPINYYRNLPFTRLNIDSGEQIDNKTLLLIGNMDPFVTIESIIQSAEYVEVSRVKIIPGAHHFPHQEKSDAVNKAIIKFLIGEFYFFRINKISLQKLCHLIWMITSIYLYISCI